MKKTAKRLGLHRETLRNLQHPDLKWAAGGGNTREDMTGCACTDTCGTVHCGGGSATCGTFRCTLEDMTTCVC